MQEYNGIPYDLTGQPIYALVVGNTYAGDDDESFSLPRRNANDVHVAQRLREYSGTHLTHAHNQTGSNLKQLVTSFLRKINEATKNSNGGPVVTFFYFSGFGTLREDDVDQAILCGTDYKNKLRGEAFRLLFDYIDPLSTVPGLHMLLLDCGHLQHSLPFDVPHLPPRFHVFYTNESSVGDEKKLVTPLTQLWCSLSSQNLSVEQLCKGVRMALVHWPKTAVYECSTLHNHFVFQ